VTEDNEYCFEVLPGEYDIWVESQEFVPKKIKVAVGSESVLG